MCDHIYSGCFELEIYEHAHDHPTGFSQGDVIWTRDVQQIYRCPVCHEYYGDVVATLDKEDVDGTN